MSNYEACNGLTQLEKNKCMAEIDIYSHMIGNEEIFSFIKDETPPALTNGYDAQVISETIASAMQVGPQEPAPEESIIIPTNTSHMLNLPKSAYTSNNKGIKFKIAKKYSQIESTKIWKAVRNNVCTTDSCRGGLGDKIIFDKYGNLKILDRVTNVITTIENDNLDVTLQDNISNLNFLNHSLDTISDVEKFILSGVYDLSIKCFMNINGSYIIYTPNIITMTTATSGIPTLDPPSGIRYYLLYNPIHTPEFQKWYRLYLQIRNPGQDQSGRVITEPLGGYANQTESFQEPGSAQGQSNTFTVNSYENVISRYCNAFKIKSHKLANGRRSQIYLDPVCSIALSEDSARLAFILGQNYTQECSTYDYWGIENNSDSSRDREAYVRERAKLFATTPGWVTGTITDSTPNWACSNHSGITDDTALDWLETMSQNLSLTSQSFLNILANAHVNLNASQYVSGQPNRIDFSGGLEIVPQPTCNTLNSVPITICSSTLEFQGDSAISASEINFVNACNGSGSNTSDSGEHPRIFAFAFAYPDSDNLMNSNAAQIIPIFEGGTGKITTTPPLTDPRDIRSIQNNVLSGSTINIRKILETTIFKLTVTSPSGTVVIFEEVEIDKIDNEPPELTEGFPLWIIAIVVVILLILLRR